jgi:pimeloyl-ACP methyl ester carboxylesterase
MINKTIHYNQIKVNYAVYGNGLPVVLIHGFGEDSSIWENQIPILEKSFKLIVPDLPGSGKSEQLLSENTSIDDYVKVIHAILKNETINSFVIIGHSMGGYISLAYAEKYPDSLMGLGLFHSTAFADSEIKKETRKKAMAFIAENGAQAFLKTSTPGLFFNIEKHQAPINELLSKGIEFANETLISYYHAMLERPERTSVLSNATFPVLFIAGQYDIAVPLADSLKQATLANETWFHVLQNAGHMGMIEETEKANEILECFLEKFLPI